MIPSISEQGEIIEALHQQGLDHLDQFPLRWEAEIYDQYAAGTQLRLEHELPSGTAVSTPIVYGGEAPTPADHISAAVKHLAMCHRMASRDAELVGAGLKPAQAPLAFHEGHPLLAFYFAMLAKGKAGGSAILRNEHAEIICCDARCSFGNEATVRFFVSREGAFRISIPGAYPPIFNAEALNAPLSAYIDFPDAESYPGLLEIISELRVTKTFVKEAALVVQLRPARAILLSSPQVDHPHAWQSLEPCPLI